MKAVAVAFLALALGLRADGNNESIVSKSHESSFLLIEVFDPKTDLKWYHIRDARTQKEVRETDDPNNTSGDDYLNPGFGSPIVQWSPTNSRMLLITSKLYRDRGYSCAVFRITDDLKLVRVPIRDEAIPERWNHDGTLVVTMRVEAVYGFDPTKKEFRSITENQGKKP